ncbi:MAG: hypothetical protein M1823_004458 [Watsoniomyces obsoletus]|nr:MAG: hypothetical protein M1823_004458 [Watsoniomyces obsoletus]
MTVFGDITLSNPWIWLAGAAALSSYVVSIAVYRLYFSPVARFPGPKLAALTYWYEGYYDLVKRGRYTWKIKEMHEKYGVWMSGDGQCAGTLAKNLVDIGPIIRINPEELHIDEPDFYDELYGTSRKLNKWAYSAHAFGNRDAMFTTISHDLHRMRRAPLSPFFSKRSVSRLEPIILSSVKQLCKRIQEFQETGEPLNLNRAFSALTIDIIMDYSFARSYNCLAAPDFAPVYFNVMVGMTQATPLIKQFGFLLPLMRSMPESLVLAMDSPLSSMVRLEKDSRVQAQATIDNKDNPKSTTSHPTIFQEIVHSDLPPEEKTVQRVTEDGGSVITAGTVTTAHFLSVTSYHILANPDIHRKLKRELEEVMPNPTELPPLHVLEQLPYLKAIISEGLRMSYGVSTRLQRVSPDSPIKFHDWVIPPGTPVGMSSYLMHNNPDLFPDPDEFRPERYLKQDDANGGPDRKGSGSSKRLEKYLVNFGRGTRSCIGMNLAFSEIHHILAAVFRRFDLELYETTRRDVDTQHDFVIPLPALDSKGVRVLVK